MNESIRWYKPNSCSSSHFGTPNIYTSSCNINVHTIVTKFHKLTFQKWVINYETDKRDIKIIKDYHHKPNIMKLEIRQIYVIISAFQPSTHTGNFVKHRTSAGTLCFLPWSKNRI